ncbi:MAG TPA: hypothetical protein VK655_07040 [Solirubrobacteraceae bacterium]|nr:hypothetical protein [Solirubrobacteraceae bacterium]
MAVRSGSAGLQDTLREAAELRAAHEDAIELALVSAVPNGISRLVVDAKSHGWLVSYRRNMRRADFGTISFEHPDDPAHNCTIELPVPDNERTQREIEMDVRMRIGLLRAA